MQFHEGIQPRGYQEFLVRERLGFGLCRRLHAFQKAFPESMRKCSRIGPRLKAGKNVSAPTIAMVETSRVVNSGPVTGNVPAEAGDVFLDARFPAMARIGITTKNLPISVAIPMVELYQTLFAFVPPNPEPLFPVADV